MSNTYSECKKMKKSENSNCYRNWAVTGMLERLSTATSILKSRWHHFANYKHVLWLRHSPPRNTSMRNSCIFSEWIYKDSFTRLSRHILHGHFGTITKWNIVKFKWIYYRGTQIHIWMIPSVTVSEWKHIILGNVEFDINCKNGKHYNVLYMKQTKQNNKFLERQTNAI